ncbi:MAG: hypothetical protein KJP02_07225 [Octadecabacter sp.]|nr:hypothetical protein [Octadecabacter sp.]
MEISNAQAVNVRPQQAPPPPVADARPTADVAAVTKDATPFVPLPMAPTQNALVSSAALSSDRQTPVKSGETGVSPAERTLKPYGVTMLPNREQNTPDMR